MSVYTKLHWVIQETKQIWYYKHAIHTSDPMIECVPKITLGNTRDKAEMILQACYSNACDGELQELLNQLCQVSQSQCMYVGRHKRKMYTKTITIWNPRCTHMHSVRNGMGATDSNWWCHHFLCIIHCKHSHNLTTLCDPWQTNHHSNWWHHHFMCGHNELVS